jgi:hypothetical protein
MADGDLPSEAAYDAARLGQWLTGRARGDGMSRRGMLRMLGTAGLAAAVSNWPGPSAAALPDAGAVLDEAFGPSPTGG